MTKINDGNRVDPIFRQARADDYRVKNMLLRDYFAGQAIVGLISACDQFTEMKDANDWAALAYSMADAMLAARSGGQDNE